MEQAYSPKNFEATAHIIGFTGSISSGCSLFAKTLPEFTDYKYYSLSKPIHKIAEERFKEGSLKKITQDDLQDIGNDLRKNYGPHYLALEILKTIDRDCETNKFDRVIIDSIRNDYEIKYFRQFPNFFLFSVYADYKTRFDRWSIQNPTASLQDFRNVDLRDTAEIFEYGQKVEKCTYESDIVINNDEKIEINNPVARKEHVKSKIQKYLELIEKGPSINIRPEKHEKLMTLAYLESLSSSCLQRKVGAVVTSGNGDILSTGFNHVPLSEKTCSEQYGECYRNSIKKTHAERIKFCPECGKEIKIKCNGCDSEIKGYKPKCPTCEKIIKFDYTCPDCNEKIYEIYTPGGKQSIGKLLDVCRALHAEENAIVNLAKLGITTTSNKVIYSTTFPCKLCANKIVQAGIDQLVYSEPYTMEEAVTILNNRNVDIIKFEGVKSSAFFRLYGS